MKRSKLFAGLLAAALLFSACSARADTDVPVNSGTGGGSSETALLVQQGAFPGFTDVAPDIWYAEAADWCREQGLVNGTSDTIFSPDETMTHAMLLTILHRAAGCPKAGNSGGSTWYSEAVAWSGEEGLTADYDNGYLDPNTSVSREQIAVILWQYAGSPTSSAAEDFEDEDNISTFAQTAVDWARNLGVMDGIGDNRFDPKGTTTRAQTVVVLHRYLSHAGDTSGGGGSIVYMTADISPQGLMEIYEALNRPAQGENVAVKLSMGEPGGHNFLQPALIQDLVQEVDGTIVDSNTAYGGRRRTMGSPLLPRCRFWMKMAICASPLRVGNA